MAMTERVRTLRRKSIDAVPELSTERAELITDFYRRNDMLLPVPIVRARAFAWLMDNKTVFIGDGELIVGERGPVPKATPTYPELCCHSLEDLDILDSREKVPFKVSGRTRELYKDHLIDFWKGRSMRDLIFRHTSDAWKKAYNAGVFTEFMEQRAPGHTVLGEKIYRKGFLDLKSEIRESIKERDGFDSPESLSEVSELKAMELCVDALINFAGRYAAEAEALAAETSNAERKRELEQIAAVCERVPANAPRTFHEALQYYWFVHLGVVTELNTWDSFNPGRLDQHLYPFYQREMKAGTLTRAQAEEMLQCFWIKFNNQPAPPKVGVTAAESSTYTDFALINTGGVKPDGSDAVNDLSYLILDVIETMRLVQPSSCLQISKKNPDRFVKRAVRIIKTGFGQPSLFNTDVIIQELLRQGKDIIDARKGGASGCVEVGAFGRENYNLTGYLNMPKIFEITLHNGVDPENGERIGIETGDPRGFNSFAELMAAYKKQLDHFVDIKVRGNNVIERLYAQYMPSPFMSILIDDCIARGKDYHNGGPCYNTSYIQGVGLGSLTDMAASIKYHVFDKGALTMDSLLSVLTGDFKDNERLRSTFLNKTPKYGNDDDYADFIMKEFFEFYFTSVDGRKNTKGGTYHINLLPTTVHVYFGSKIGATADGRPAHAPLSEGISPVQGADRKGPTAVFRSVAKMDHARTGGTLLNQKFTPELLDDEEGLDKLVALIRSYFKLDGHHVQFNVVKADTLRSAQKEPEKYRDLIVRVAGYSDYFCDLTPALQEEIIRRTEHEALS